MATSRNPPGPVPTLAELRKGTPWVRLICANHKCRHWVPLALVPVIIRLGPDTSSDVLRGNVKCSKCGHVGALTYLPSYVDATVGFQPFPVETLTALVGGKADPYASGAKRPE